MFNRTAPETDPILALAVYSSFGSGFKGLQAVYCGRPDRAIVYHIHADKVVRHIRRADIPDLLQDLAATKGVKIYAVYS